MTEIERLSGFKSVSIASKDLPEVAAGDCAEYVLDGVRSICAVANCWNVGRVVFETEHLFVAGRANPVIVGHLLCEDHVDRRP